MRISTHTLRRLSQGGALLGFLALFVATEYRGVDELPYPVGLLFRIDPLALLADLFAPGAPHWSLLWPALVLIILSLIFGRFFCGWLCPLGTLLDLLPVKARGGVGIIGRQRIKYLLLFSLCASALLGVQLFGLFDPLSIFLRTLTFALYPVYNLVMNGIFDFAYQHQLPVINDAYPFFRDHLMAFVQPAFTLSLFTFAVFAAILLLEKLERRFWCRNLCPLGALFGLAAGASRWSRNRISGCGGCTICANNCRMGALGGEEEYRRAECIHCRSCQQICPQDKVVFSLKGQTSPAGISLPRRTLLGAIGTGLITAPVMAVTPPVRLRNPYLIRPPGAADEDAFLRRCIRCGECMKVCIGQALHPAFHEAGVAGLWTPLLVARLGYCEYNCTLCGQVCPTGAIRHLGIDEKRKVIIGTAVFDKNRCLPYARGEECLVCEEHCPTGEKAIIFDEREILFGSEPRTLKIPRVEPKRCIGCGICETKCPVAGASAIRVIHEGESRRRNDGWEL